MGIDFASDSFDDEPIGDIPDSNWDKWARFVEFARSEDELIGALLSDIGLVGIDGDHIEIALAPGSVASARIREGVIRSRLKGLASKHFGKEMFFKPARRCPDIESAPSLILVEASSILSHRESIISEVKSDPKIGSILTNFKGYIESIDFEG